MYLIFFLAVIGAHQLLFRQQLEQRLQLLVVCLIFRIQFDVTIGVHLIYINGETVNAAQPFESELLLAVGYPHPMLQCGIKLAGCETLTGIAQDGHAFPRATMVKRLVNVSNLLPGCGISLLVHKLIAGDGHLTAFLQVSVGIGQ